MQIVSEHLAALRASRHEPQGPVGGSPRDWGIAISGAGAELPTGLPSRQVSRAEVIDLFRDEAISSETAFLTCMAWGAMRYDHGRMAWAARAPVLPIIDQLRSGQFHRQAAYEALAATRTRGMGPAYFTKLIFFGLAPTGAEKPGYILDQWTGISVNLLFGTDVVDLLRTPRGWYVKPSNDDRVYERFCASVDCLHGHFGVDLKPSDVEERIFSRGGRGTKKGDWRKYVLANG